MLEPEPEPEPRKLARSDMRRAEEEGRGVKRGRRGMWGGGGGVQVIGDSNCWREVGVEMVVVEDWMGDGEMVLLYIMECYCE